MRVRFRLIPVTLVATTLVGGIKVGQIFSSASIFFGVPAAVAKTDQTSAAPALPSLGKGAPIPLPPSLAATPAAHAGAAAIPAAVPATASPSGASSDLAAAPQATVTQTPPPSTPAAKQEGNSKPRLFDNPTQFSRADISLLQDLTKRRRELDQREQAIDMREKLLTAMSKRLDAKIAEMRTLQVRLTKLLAKRRAEHSQRIKNLVEVYQQMKPKAAARIFSRLDMTILLEVVSKMSENKLAPILAAMDPAKVQIITTDLATEGGDAGAGTAGGAIPSAANHG